MTAAEERDVERDAQRKLLAEEDRLMKERQAKGIVEPLLDLKDHKLLDAVVKVGSIAKQASRTKVAIRAHDDAGKLTTLEERIGNEEIILATLLNQRLNSMMESER